MDWAGGKRRRRHIIQLNGQPREKLGRARLRLFNQTQKDMEKLRSGKMTNKTVIGEDVGRIVKQSIFRLYRRITDDRLINGDKTIRVTVNTEIEEKV